MNLRDEDVSARIVMEKMQIRTRMVMRQIRGREKGILKAMMNKRKIG